MPSSLPGVPHAWVANDDATSGNLQTLTDNINYLRGVPVASVWSSANISIPNGGTGAVLTWDSEEFDTDSVHSTVTNTERFTIVTPGVYVATLDFVWQAGAVAGVYTDVRVNANLSATNRMLGRDVRPWINSASIVGSAGSLATPPVRVAVGDYFYASALHGYTSALTVTGGQYVGTRFGLYWLAA